MSSSKTKQPTTKELADARKSEIDQFFSDVQEAAFSWLESCRYVASSAPDCTHQRRALVARMRAIVDEMDKATTEAI